MALKGRVRRKVDIHYTNSMIQGINSRTGKKKIT